MRRVTSDSKTGRQLMARNSKPFVSEDSKTAIARSMGLPHMGKKQRDKAAKRAARMSKEDDR